jgi:hypothetical protein
MAVLAAIIKLLLTLSILADTEEILADRELSAGSCVGVVDGAEVCDDASCAQAETARNERRKVTQVGDRMLLGLQQKFSFRYVEKSASSLMVSRTPAESCRYNVQIERTKRKSGVCNLSSRDDVCG